MQTKNTTLGREPVPLYTSLSLLLLLLLLHVVVGGGVLSRRRYGVVLHALSLSLFLSLSFCQYRIGS